MPTNITRRDVLRLAGGSFLGILFTPLPWKLLDDTAIWTQNWSLTPKLPRGPVAFRHTTCSLCPAACGVKARTVSGLPFALSGTTGHPISQGVLCPVGYGAHQVPFHPLRVASPRKFSAKGEDGVLLEADGGAIIDEISQAITSRSEGELVAVLDRQPGRLISGLYGEFLANVPGGVLLASPNREGEFLENFQQSPGMACGLDYEHAATILSFGAPLFEGWGTPGRMQSLLGSTPSSPRVILVQSSQARTSRFGKTLRVHPGSEGALALALGNVIIKKGLAPSSLATSWPDYEAYREGVRLFTPELVSSITGLTPGEIEGTAEELVRSAPALVTVGSDPAGGPLPRSAQIAAAALNVLLGSYGRTGGIVPRRQLHGTTPKTTDILSIPEKSIRVLMLDGAESGYAFPWEILESRLAENSLVVSFSSAVSGIAVHADRFLPAPAPFESLQDLAAPWDASRATFALSSPLFPLKPGTVEARERVFQLADKLGIALTTPRTTTEAARQRTARIFAEKKGSLFTPGSTKPIKDLTSEDELWEGLTSGGVWLDDAAGGTAVRVPTFFQKADEPSPVAGLVLEITGAKGELNAGAATPLITKLYQESGIRDDGSLVRIHPETASALGISGGDAVLIKTRAGVRKGVARLDPTINRRVIRSGVGPAPAGKDAAEAQAGLYAGVSIAKDGTWRYTEATLQKG